MKKFLSILTVFVICFSMCVPALAANKKDDTLCTVDYTNASQFLFNPEGGDLFKNFKGVMPGDVLTQNIVISNKQEKRNVTLYLRAEIDKKYKTFLDNIEIEILLTRGENGKPEVLSKNKASEPGALATNVCLGTYKPGENGMLTVNLTVDKKMGNEFKNQTGVIEWIFSAEEGEEQTTKPTQPEPTTLPTTVPTTVPATKGTTVPTTLPLTTQEPTTKPPKLPDTGSPDIAGVVIPAVLILVSLGLIVVLRNKKDSTKANNDEDKNDD